MNLSRIFGSLLVALALAATSRATCGVSAVCSDTTASLTGQIIVEGFRLSWSTNDEQGIASYKVYRIVGTTRTLLETVSPVATCGTAHEYTSTDPTPADSYQVEVWAPNAAYPACMQSVINGTIGG